MSVGAIDTMIGLHKRGDGTDFIGYVDEVAIWNRSLSETDVVALYNSGSGTQYDLGAPAVPIVTVSLDVPANAAVILNTTTTVNMTCNATFSPNASSVNMTLFVNNVSVYSLIGSCGTSNCSEFNITYSYTLSTQGRYNWSCQAINRDSNTTTTTAERYFTYTSLQSWTTNLSRGLVVYYNFEQPSGNLVDVLRGKYNMTQQGAVNQSSAGKIGNAYIYNKTSTMWSEYNATSWITDFEDTGSVTVNAWYKTDGMPNTVGSDTTRVVLFSLGNSTTSNGFINLGSYVGGTGGIICIMANDLSSEKIACDTGSTQDGNWHMATVSLNASGVTLYVDGTFKAVDMNAYGLPVMSGINRMCVGTFCRATTNYRIWNGSADEIGVWNRSLSESEINLLYNSGYGLNYSTSSGSEPATPLTSYNSTVTISNTQIGQISSGFYGSNVMALGGINGNISVFRTSCTLESNASYDDNRAFWEDSGMKLIRKNMNIEYASTGENTWSSTYLANRGNLVQYAASKGYKVSFIVIGMPSWLANTTEQCNTDTISCPPKNYTKWTNAVIQYLDNLTENGKYNSTIQLEIWNEAYGDFMRNLTNDNPTRFTEFAKLYNNTYWAIKNKYPTIPIASPALYRLAPNFTRFFFSNFSNQFDILNFHEYYDYNDGFTRVNRSMNDFLRNCTAYSANCTNMYMSEFNLDGSYWGTYLNGNLHKATFPATYSDLLNYYSSYNVQTASFMFDSIKTNGTCYTLKNYSMYDVVTNTSTVIYNQTKVFATNHKANNIVYETTSTNTSLKVVTSKDSTKTYITLTNTLNQPVNVTINDGMANTNWRDVETGIVYSDTINNISAYGVMTLESETAVNIIPYGINPTSGSTINTKYLFLGANVSSVNPLDVIIFALNNTNYSLYDDNLIMFYNFNNYSALGENATRVVDISKNGKYNLTLAGLNFNISTGKYGFGLLCNSSYTTGISFSNTDFNNSALSVCFWKKEGINKNDQWHNVFSRKDPSHRRNEFTGYTYNVTGYFYGEFWLPDGSGVETQVISDNNLLDNQWHHYCVVANKVNATLYVDGVNNDFKTFTNFNITNTTGTFKIYDDFNGTLDDFMVYKRDLSQEDVNIIYGASFTKYNSTSYTFIENRTYPNLITLYMRLFINDSSSNYASLSPLYYTNYITNIVVDYSSSRGKINDYFYGVNYHSGWFSAPNKNLILNNGSYIKENITWHQEKRSNANLIYLRNDMSLGSYYGGWYNGDMVDWINTSTGIVNTYKETAKGWYISTTSGANCSGTLSNDNLTSPYSLNVTGYDLPNCFAYRDATFRDGHNYSYIGYIKGNGTTSAAIQKLSDYNVCGSASGTITANSSWQRFVASCNVTTAVIEGYRLPIMSIGVNESILIDNVTLLEDGVPYQYWRMGNITMLYNDYQYNHARGLRSLEIQSYMPYFLENSSSGCITQGRCAPTDYHLFALLTVDYYDRITGCEGNQTCRDSITDIDNEVWNEPYGGFLLDNYSADSWEKSRVYNKIYNATWVVLKAAYPNISIGGPSGSTCYNSTYCDAYSPNMFDGFLSNFSDKMDFISWHPYDSDYRSDFMNKSIESLDAVCKKYNADCSRKVLSEWNSNGDLIYNYTTRNGLLATSNIFNTPSLFRKLENDNLYAYSQLLNSYPSNISNNIYQWSTGYNITYVPYTDSGIHYDMVDEVDNLVYPIYTATANLSRYCPNGGTVTRSYTDDPNTVVIGCLNNLGNRTLVVINKEDDYKNISVSLNSFSANKIRNSQGTTYDLVSGNGNIGTLGPYEVGYFIEYNSESTPVSSTNDNGFTRIILNILLGVFAIGIVGIGLWFMKYYYDEGELTPEKMVYIVVAILLAITFLRILADVIIKL